MSSLNVSQATKNTAYVDAFYIWRHGSKEQFWEVINAEDFERCAKEQLFLLLSEHSKGDVKTLIGGYYYHLKKFREFALNGTKESCGNLNTEVGRALVASKTIPAPCKDEVEKYLKKWRELEHYYLQECALNKLFHNLCPQNTKIEEVLLKCATLNDFYSTSIFSIYPVAKHIVDLNIDERVKKGDITLVYDLQSIAIGGKVRNFYSFATKYCSHHNAADYPIYDSYVECVLFYFKKQHGFSKFKLSDLKDYIVFKETLIAFREFYGLEEFSLKQIDQYLWLLGKEYFPKKYK